jgi:hypothetical protein
MSQTSYPTVLDKKPGVWEGDDNVFFQGINDQNQLRYGVFVEEDITNDDRGIDVLDNASVIGGIAGVVARVPYATDEVTGDNEVPQNAVVPYVRRGLVRVLCNLAMAVGDDIYVIKNPAGAEVAGSIRPSADGTDTVQIQTGAKVIEGAGAGGAALLEINVPLFT